VLDPVLGKRTVKRGRAMVMRIGDAEVEYDSQFRWAHSIWLWGYYGPSKEVFGRTSKAA
jgi:hypothetical protein